MTCKGQLVLAAVREYSIIVAMLSSISSRFKLLLIEKPFGLQYSHQGPRGGTFIELFRHSTYYGTAVMAAI